MQCRTLPFTKLTVEHKSHKTISRVWWGTSRTTGPQRLSLLLGSSSEAAALVAAWRMGASTASSCSSRTTTPVLLPSVAFPVSSSDADRDLCCCRRRFQAAPPRFRQAILASLRLLVLLGLRVRHDESSVATMLSHDGRGRSAVG